jgi:catechol 2,3-dioxygenase-like lactoylglutathione lyase family enzyme
MSPTIDVITLGVTDLERSARFYERGLGGRAQPESGGVTLELGPNASRFQLREWDAVAQAAGVVGASSGFRAFTLSYILESADEVDRILERAERHGGRVSKPPKNAVWGYSAYVTDPSGYLWKIASSKRRSLIGRSDPSAQNGHAITVQEVPITIGVADMKRAKEFYKDGLGLPVKKAFGNKFVMFEGEGGTSDLGMYKREALAKDASVRPDGTGFHGFHLAHVADSVQAVDALLSRAGDAGGEIVKTPAEGPAGTYGGYFADLDGNLWCVSCRT